MLLTMEGVDQSYALRKLLDQAELYVEERDKIGIIGVNGAGKSTLLRILAGLQEPDAGKITRKAGIQAAYLAQNPQMQPDTPVLEQVFLGVGARVRDVKEYEAKSILTRLGINAWDQPVGQLSGGQRKRVALASVLAVPCEVLLLDEPTNHLDSDMVVWLEKWLAAYTGGLVMVTHDRYFLERVTGKIVELEAGKLIAYPANYSKYLEMKAEREERAAGSERKRQALLKKELAWLQRGARARTTKAKGRVERAEALRTQAAPQTEGTLKIETATSRLGRKIVEMNGVSMDYGKERLIHDFSYTLLRDDRIGVVGRNGCGKSTLLHLIAGDMQPKQGEVVRGDTVKIGYFRQEPERMDGPERAVDYIRQAGDMVETGEGKLSAVQMMERFLFDTQRQYTQVARLSGGEKRRLYLLRVLMGAPNVLLLDEPTNDLDIQTLTILEDYLDSFQGAVLAASHDRYFLDKVAVQIFSFEGEGRIQRSPGGWSDWARTRQPLPATPKPASSRKPAPPPAQRERKRKLTFKEQREYDSIESMIAEAEAALAKTRRKIDQTVSDYAALQTLLAEQAELDARLEQLLERWTYLSQIAEQQERDQPPFS